MVHHLILQNHTYVLGKYNPKALIKITIPYENITENEIPVS